jgi:hypothetical protein
LNFVNLTESGKHYMLQNLLLAKMVYDRGYSVSGYQELTLLDILELFFGKTVTIEETEIFIPGGLNDTEEESEEEFLLSWFQERPQYIVKIPLPFTCTPAEEEELLTLLKRVTPSEDEILYMRDMFFIDTAIEQGKTAVIRIVDFHPKTCIDDEFIDICSVFETIIDFRDKIVEIKGRSRRNNGLNKHQAA